MTMQRQGQFGVVITKGKYSEAIRFFQSLRMPPTLAKYTHSVIAIDDRNIVEAMPGGARINRADEYDTIVWSDQHLTNKQACNIRRFALDQLGKPYAWEDIPLIAVALATGEHTPDWLEAKLSSDQRWICSELVDAAYQHAGVHLFKNIPPAAVYPAMLARLVMED